MNGIEQLAGVIGILFITGIVIGVLIVAVPRWRGRRPGKGGDWREPPRRYRADDERPPRWPGG